MPRSNRNFPRAVDSLRRQTARSLGIALTLSMLGLSTTLSGCRTTNDDVERWSNTKQGPHKLVAVLTHDKYPLDLRVEAALAMVRMKPRGGQHIGIQGSDDLPGLIPTLETMPPAERDKIINRLVPKLVEKMGEPPPKAQAGQSEPPDPSTPYKDAAFAILTHNDGSLLQSEELKKSIRTALTRWAMESFAKRLDDSSQLYGMEQVLRELGAQGVAELPKQIEPNAKKIDKMAQLIADLGSPEAKLQASQALVTVAKDTDSQKWVERTSPIVEAANKASKLNPSADQFKAQLDQYQEEELLRVFTSMKKVGQKPIVDYLLGYAKDTSKPEKRRAAAVAALEGNIDKQNKEQVDAILELATGKDVADSVRDVALARVGELPREAAVTRLYSLFNADNWKIRWVAAELLLKMSKTNHVPEFMSKISRIRGMALTEPLRYGALLGQMSGPQKPVDLADRYARDDNSVESRLIALGYYYEHGTKNELSKVNSYSGDSTKVPSCPRDAEDCEWQCAIGEGKKQEVKEVSTVGDYVTYCVKPAMEKRDETAKKSKKDGN